MSYGLGGVQLRYSFCGVSFRYSLDGVHCTVQVRYSLGGVQVDRWKWARSDRQRAEPGGKLRAAKIATGPLAHCSRCSPPIISFTPIPFLFYFVRSNLSAKTDRFLMSRMAMMVLRKVLPGGTESRQNSRRSFGLLSPE